MHDIFINYRNGDEEATATLIEHELSRRFGSDQVFRASKSIMPGEDYIATLLTAVRRSRVLLAVIGSRWLTGANEKGHNRLEDEADWVRGEILEAFEHGVHVIPVLVGRRQPRLDPSQLPPELVRLANLQSRVLDTHSSVLREIFARWETTSPSLSLRSSTATRARRPPEQTPTTDRPRRRCTRVTMPVSKAAAPTLWSTNPAGR